MEQTHRTVEKLSDRAKKRLGQNVAALRLKAGITQERLAELAGVDRRFVQKIELGEFGASMAVLCRIRQALKTDWNDLLREL